jgi:hypothetical protein
MMNGAAIESIDAIDPRHVVSQARGQQHLSRGGSEAAGAGDREFCLPTLDRNQLVVTQGDVAVGAQLLAAFREQFNGRHSFIAKQTMHGVRSFVPRMAVITNEHTATAPTEDKRGAKTRGTAACNHNIV